MKPLHQRSDFVLVGCNCRAGTQPDFELPRWGKEISLAKNLVTNQLAEL
jgi:hypothetical protein